MNINTITRPNILNMAPYSSARDEFEYTAEVYLDANENPFNNGINRYPDPHQKILKTAIAKLKGVQPENLLLGNGSDEVIDLLFRAFCEPALDHVIITPPTYGMYKVCANLNSIDCKEVNLNTDFSLNTEALLAAITPQTKLIFLCNPNNPTGNTLAASAIEQILNATQGLVVIDEAYIDFAPNDSWISRLSNYPNLVIIQTLSKAWGMAGIRLGIGIASAEIIKILSKIKAPYNINQLSQTTALQCLADESTFTQRLNYLLTEKTKLYKTLNELPIVRKIHPSDANFFLVEFDKANAVYQALLEQSIVVRNRSNQVLCNNCLRLTIGLEDENQRLIIALKQISSSVLFT